jgi:hypothetical protein
MAQFPSTTSASGIWTLKKQKRAEQGDNWPLVSPPADDYFEYVTMLLPGNGTNGAQNNTFLDSSTNNFTITRNGNTTQGTFSPYGSNWGNYFDGTGDWLSSPSNAAFDFGSGNFTIEFWFYVNSAPAGSSVGLLSKRANESVYAPFNIFWSTTNVVTLFMSTSGSSWEVGPLSTAALTTGTWYHLAVTRSSNTVYMFLNGTSIGSTGTLSGALMTNSSALTIGAASESPASVTRLNGYISNLRFVKGTALYTANFTVPTSPLTAVTNTSLLTCQSNRFIDNSTNALTITRNGDTSIQRFSPFSPTAPYAAGTDGGSGYFDGSGDYLQGSSSGSLAIGTQNFTVEAWVYPRTTSGYAGIVSTAFIGGSDNGLILSFDLGQAGFSIGNGSAVDGVFASSLPKDTWTHVAGTRNGSTLTLFVNGVSVGTATTSRSINTTQATIGSYYNNGGGGYVFNGYISNARIVNSVVYTSNFTPPAAPLTAITNTSLLLNFTNAGVIDNAMMNDLETVGNAQISTTQSKFGGGSMYFDGTGAVCTALNAPWMNFGTGNWTIEFWVYANSTSRADVVSKGSSSTYNPYVVQISGGQIRVFLSDDGSSYSLLLYSAASAYTTGAWIHVAVVRNGNTVTIYANGTNVGSSSYTGAPVVTTAPLSIGGASDAAFSLNGYIDDLRITKGIARYTANFTPPTTAFPTY